MDIAHLHLMLNHIPVIGVAFGLVIGSIGFVIGSKPVIRVGLGVLAFSAIVAIPVYLTGETAEEMVEKLPGVSEAVTSRHESAAKISLALAIISGGLALLALVFGRSLTSKPTSYLVGWTLMVTLLTTGSMAWTANLGGQIRHTEIRATTTDPTSANGIADRNGDAGRDDDD